MDAPQNCSMKVKHFASIGIISVHTFPKLNQIFHQRLCQMVRSGKPTGVLILVVYLFGGEIES
jgi:hypothetical protein